MHFVLARLYKRALNSSQALFQCVRMQLIGSPILHSSPPAQRISPSKHRPRAWRNADQQVLQECHWLASENWHALRYIQIMQE